MRLSLYLPDSNDQQTGDTFVRVSKTEMLVPPIRVMLCPLLPGAVREIRRETRRLPRLTVTQPFLVLSRNAPPHSEEERCVTRDDTKNGCVKDYCHAGYGMCKIYLFQCLPECSCSLPVIQHGKSMSTPSDMGTARAQRTINRCCNSKGI